MRILKQSLPAKGSSEDTDWSQDEARTDLDKGGGHRVASLLHDVRFQRRLRLLLHNLIIADPDLCGGLCEKKYASTSCSRSQRGQEWCLIPS